MKINKRHLNKGFTLVELLVVIAIIAALAAMATPVIMQQKKKADMATATHNAKQISVMLMNFDGDFSSYPNDETASADQDLRGYSGRYSNDYLGQLLAGGYTDSEENFYAPGGAEGKKKVDNDFTTKEKTLEAGECGFAYVSNQSSSVNSGRILLATPMGTSGQTFNSDAYGGKAVILFNNNSAKSMRISKSGKVSLPSGKGLFETGTDTVWGTNGFIKSDLKHAKSKGNRSERAPDPIEDEEEDDGRI